MVNIINYEINEITCEKEIKELISVSALTFEGMNTDIDNIMAIMGWLKENNAVTNKEIKFHKISGKLMNKFCELTYENKYTDDLTILSITGIDQFKIALPRFEVDGRWLDDIVDNNIRREIQC